jgi:transcriptional regulator with XRE-family HTH domain
MEKTNDFILKKFGKRVVELRLQKGIASQMALANKTGLDRTYIGGVERGERNVGLKNIEKIAKALGVSLDELFRL